jgi:hypothetical protein
LWVTWRQRRRSQNRNELEGSKPPSVRPGIRLSVRAAPLGWFGLPRAHGLAPAGISRSIDPLPSAWRRHAGSRLAPFACNVTVRRSRPRRVSFLPFRVGSLASSVEEGRVVSVPVPTVSRPGLASGRPPERVGGLSSCLAAREPGSLCSWPSTHAAALRGSVVPTALSWAGLPRRHPTQSFRPDSGAR